MKCKNPENFKYEYGFKRVSNRSSSMILICSLYKYHFIKITVLFVSYYINIIPYILVCLAGGQNYQAYPVFLSLNKRKILFIVCAMIDGISRYKIVFNKVTGA